MSKETIQDYFAYYTQKSGDIVRQLGLVGVGIVWTMHTILNEKSINLELKCILFIISISLAIDLMQYVVGSILWGINWHNASTGAASHTCKKTIWTTVGFIAVKITVMCVAYIQLILYFWSNF